MFIEVNELKKLIVNIENFDEKDDKEWGKIASLIEIIFLYSNEERKKVFIKNVAFPVSFFKIKQKFFYFNLWNSISDSLRHFNLQPYEVAYVSNNKNEISMIINEPIGTILISPDELTYNEIGTLPDFKVRKIEELVDIISEKYKGYFSEICATILNTSLQPYGKAGYFLSFKLPVGERECNVFSGGRYFGRKHIKRNCHQLSHRIYKSKFSSSQDDLFYSIYQPIITWINDNIIKIDGITRVPPRPISRRDRLEPIVKKICINNSLDNLSKALVCIANYPSQKTLNKAERQANIKGKFKASNSFNGKNVVLIDDVFATGATVTECAEVIYNQGAKNIFIVVLAINQFDNIFRSRKFLPCTNHNCDGIMRLRFSNNDKTMFFGCSNYSVNNCNGISYLNGWKEYNKQNKLNETEDDGLFNF